MIILLCVVIIALAGVVLRHHRSIRVLHFTSMRLLDEVASFKVMPPRPPNVTHITDVPRKIPGKQVVEEPDLKQGFCQRCHDKMWVDDKTTLCRGCDPAYPEATHDGVSGGLLGKKSRPAHGGKPPGPRIVKGKSPKRPDPEEFR